MAFELTNDENKRLDAASFNLFLSTFPGIFEDFSDFERIKRRFSCAAALRVGASLIDVIVEDGVRLLGYGPSMWETIERRPTEYATRQHQKLYRAFLALVASDFTWFASAAEKFFSDADETTPTPVGPQVVAGVEEIATATRRSPAGVLRLIQGGKLKVAYVAGKPTSTQAMLRRHRRYGVSKIAA
jgi:hypothetical protein